MIPLLTGAEMKDIERDLMSQGVSLETLIDRAASALCSTVQELAPRGPILILAGPGNNGADGAGAAMLLSAAGREVTVYGVSRPEPGYAGFTFVNGDDDRDLARLTALRDASSIIVDALLGTGQNRGPEGLMAALIEAINQHGKAPMSLSVDVPTGVSTDTGVVAGSAFRADVTLCLGFGKRGTAVYPGAEFAGTTRVAPIGIPRQAASAVRVWAPEPADIAARLPRRPQASNKGESGRVLLVSGSRDFTGAPTLCAMGAYRAGAGLVEIATPAGNVATVASHSLEPVYLPLPERDGRIDGGAVPALASAMEKARTVVVGPGLGFSGETVEAMRGILNAMAEKRIASGVIDADGLNALAHIHEWWGVDLPLVLTPHPGEMSRLTGSSIQEIQADRVGIAQRHAARWGKVVVLKGAGTVIAHPDGKTAVNPTGSSNLATAGTGDVLSGIIGGLLAQGSAPWDAAMVGVYMHGKAGDILRDQQGDVGMIASDLLSKVPAARQAILRETDR
ncbi:MAG: NAD(P)H-hydrate dehydratase [Chloroflexota bacterium]